MKINLINYSHNHKNPQAIPQKGTQKASSQVNFTSLTPRELMLAKLQRSFGVGLNRFVFRMFGDDVMLMRTYSRKKDLPKVLKMAYKISNKYQVMIGEHNFSKPMLVHIRNGLKRANQLNMDLGLSTRFGLQNGKYLYTIFQSPIDKVFSLKKIKLHNELL